MQELIQAARDFGPWVVLAALLVWQLVRDKSRLIERAEKNEDRYATLAERTTAALENNTASNRSLVTAVERLTETIHAKMLDQKGCRHG